MKMAKDPLTGEAILVNDVSAACYALKRSNEHHFALKSMQKMTAKKIARNESETLERQIDLVYPYLDSDTAPIDVSLGGPVRPNYLPDPLPPRTPPEVRAAISYLDDQMKITRQRLNAELAKDSKPVIEKKTAIENAVADWYKNAKRTRETWADISDSVKWSGCTLKLKNQEVIFEYERLE